MIDKGTKLYSIVHEKCPRCQEGDLFATAPYNVLHFSEMNKACAHCGVRFGDEPSYFFGAMYLSYAFPVMIMVATCLVLRFNTNPEAWVYIVVSLTATVATIPFSFRLSRSVWINLFVSYQPEGSK